MMVVLNVSASITYESSCNFDQRLLLRRRKLDFRNSPRLGSGGEVSVVALEACPACERAIGPGTDVSVVVLDGVVVTLALDGDAIFRAFELILQPQKALIRFELRIIFREGEDFHQRAIELAVGGDFVFGRLRVHERGAGVGDGGENGDFLRGYALHGL